MGLVYPTSFTDSDLSAIQSYYSSFDEALNDLINDTVPEGLGFDTDDVFIWYTFNQGTNDFDPENPALASLFDEVADVMQEVLDLNLGNTDFTYLLNDYMLFLESAGESTDPMSQAEDILNQHISEGFVPSGDPAGLDAEVTNLLAGWKQTDIFVWMLLNTYYVTGKMAQESFQDIADKQIGLQDEMADVIDELEGFDAERQADNPGELSALQSELQGMREVQETLKNIGELVNDIVMQGLEAAGTGRKREQDAMARLIQLLGG